MLRRAIPINMRKVTDSMDPNHTMAIFAAELILLLFAGRLLGEGMSRIGQPAIFGQLLAGVLLGPSVFGAVLPGPQHAVFPGTPALKSMIDALSHIGVLLLLLLTGMETNLALVKRKRRAVISTSVFGIAVPFVCGVALAFNLPAALIPSPSARLVTALFLGTALSISSVKIVAMVLMEVGAIRRDLGQLILATAILDDTIAWVMIAVIAGMAAHGSVSLSGVTTSLAGTLLFLGVSLTIGRRVVAQIIRWTNDNLTIEVPVITAILLVMLSMALTTELIGVHTALGAFVAGVLVGQSPILTEHIEAELRGFILAFFSPVFFAVAGLGMDLRSLMNPTLLGLTLAMILVATIGKFLGALAGGRVGGLTGRESLALATGLNARGSTEVIIASIGLSMGVLSQDLYTMIVAMAVVTTLAMPPTLRWMLARVPVGEDEAKRLEKEEAEETETVPKMERALVLLDDSPNAGLAARLAGIFAAGRQVVTTVMQLPTQGEGEAQVQSLGHGIVQQAAGAIIDGDLQAAHDGEAATPERMTLSELVHAKPLDAEGGIEKEATKGYSVAFAGIDQPMSESAHRFDAELASLIDAFDGPVAIALNGARSSEGAGHPLNILVPTGGTSHARLATEIALALAKATGGRLTVLHVFDPAEDTDLLRGRARRLGSSVLVDARRLGKRSGVHVDAMTAVNARPEIAIRRAASAGQYDLVVLGASLRLGDRKFLGSRSAALVHAIGTPILLIAQ
jgi:Kef-type K+ transport system membrane component KefB/nucleotide-binding universal stress UspA family protein